MEKKPTGLDILMNLKKLAKWTLHICVNFVKPVIAEIDIDEEETECKTNAHQGQ
jgi:hypothetical protein